MQTTKHRLTYSEASMRYSRGLLTWEELLAMKGNFLPEYSETCKHKNTSAHPAGTSCADCGSDLRQDGSGNYVVVD